MILQASTEKELLELMEGLQKRLAACESQNKALVKKLEEIKSDVDSKPNVVIKETIIKEIEKPTIQEVQTIKIDSKFFPTIKKLSARVKALEDKKPEVIEKETIIKTDVSILPTLKKLSDRLALLENKKPITAEKETIIKEIEKPTIKEITILKTDLSILPTLKKLSDRLKVLEELTTHEIKTVDAASKKEIESIKKAIASIKPEIKNITEGLKSDEVLSIIDERVTMLYINKLYKKGAKNG